MTSIGKARSLPLEGQFTLVRANVCQKRVRFKAFEIKQQTWQPGLSIYIIQRKEKQKQKNSSSYIYKIQLAQFFWDFFFPFKRS